MKKILFISILILSFILMSPVDTTAKEDEHILSDAFLTTLSPHISNAVTGFYGKFTQYALYDAEITSIKQTAEGRSFEFKVVVKIFPFEKAHNYIGMDTIKMDISPSGVSVTSYSHKKYQ
jgi:hypothetical protein